MRGQVKPGHEAREDDRGFALSADAARVTHHEPCQRRERRQQERGPQCARLREPARDGQTDNHPHSRAQQHQGHGVEKRPQREGRRQLLVFCVRAHERDDGEEECPRGVERGLEQLVHRDLAERQRLQHQVRRLVRADCGRIRRHDARKHQHDPQAEEEEREQAADQHQAHTAQRVEELETLDEHRPQAEQQPSREEQDEDNFEERLLAEQATHVPRHPHILPEQCPDVSHRSFRFTGRG